MTPGRHPILVGDADELRCMENILAHHPWQAFNFKHRAWVRKPRRWRSLRTGELFRWAESGDVPMQLISRETGDSIAELAPAPWLGSFGIVLFAGNPDVAGVCRDVLDRKNRAWFTHPPSLDRKTALGLCSSPQSFPFRARTVGQHPQQLTSAMWLADQPLAAAQTSRLLRRAEARLAGLHDSARGNQ